MVRVILLDSNKNIAEQFKTIVDKINEPKTLEAQRELLVKELNEFDKTCDAIQRELFYKFYEKYSDKFALIFNKDTTAKVVF